MKNHHVIFNPMKAKDGDHYIIHRNKVYSDGKLAVLKRKRQLEEYRCKRTSRLKCVFKD